MQPDCHSKLFFIFVPYVWVLPNLIPTLSIIGNVSKSTGIVILNGENDSETAV